MPLSRADRFKLKSQLFDEFKDWDMDRINLLFGEFGLDQLEDGWHGLTITDIVAKVDDVQLTEMYGIVKGLDQTEVENVVESSPDIGDNWKPGYVRLFISHSSQHKQFLGDVARELAVVGIHGFVAHDTMTYSRPWQAQIEQALRSMHAFLLVVHPEVNSSAWCSQEVGWALGRRVPVYAVRMGADPAGFLGRDQWPSATDQTARQVAAIISSWVSGLPELGAGIVDALLAALESAGNYVDAGATAERIAALDSLTAGQFARLSEVYWKNDQLNGGTLTNRALRPFYARNGQEWPPPQPQPEAPPADPWATAAARGEPPF